MNSSAAQANSKNTPAKGGVTYKCDKFKVHNEIIIVIFIMWMNLLAY